MGAVNVYDTSSVIEMSERGIRPDGPINTIYRMIEEMENHVSRGKLKSEFLQYLQTVSSPQVSASERLHLREDALMAHYEVATDKKKGRDPISQDDLALITEVLEMAEMGKEVNIYSEDSHIYKTLEHLLEDKYKDLSNQIHVKGYRRMNT